MCAYSIGDLASSFATMNQTSRIRHTIERLTDELASGRTQDVLERLGGDYTRLSDIEHRMTMLDGYRLSAGETDAVFATAEVVMGRLQDASGGLGNTLLSLGGGSTGPGFDAIAEDARTALDTMTYALNSSASGRYLFAGTQTDRAPMADSETILSALKAEIAGLTSAADISQAAQDWFDDPGGFRALAYSGSDVPLAPVEIGEDTHVSFTWRADDEAFRDAIQATALAALAAGGETDLDAAELRGFLTERGSSLKNSEDDLTVIRTELGAGQSRLAEVSARNAAERTSLDYARGALLEADPYETAVRLEDAQFRLESLYAVTVRMSQLSLTSFLR
ncbi:flagellin [Thalassococcus sp. S3]|uniref:flagellin n=1 Tax=Thalassococcus sp. S3 TaxID=2017482 RepID=UPI0010240B31|nr:flagellin [Thalassococcus sp. S3]QBF29682.1 hypothetical protein CFI11_00435 [Thalassococcus sp. S3]